MGPDAMIFVFWMLSFKPTFSLSSFTFIKGLFSELWLLCNTIVKISLHCPSILFPIYTLLQQLQHHWPFCGNDGKPNLKFLFLLLDEESQRRQWHLTPVLLPGKSHGWRSLVGCSPWGHYESDTTEQLHFHFSLSCIGEGNDNPLQYSCLENLRDGGAWWASLYGVAQNRTWLKWPSSSSSRWRI